MGAAANTMSLWERAGEVAVDSGHVLIADPAYAEMTFEQFLYTLQEQGLARGETTFQLREATNAEPIGVALATGQGDGIYPVYVQRDAEGVITAAMIRFDNDPGEPLTQGLEFALVLNESGSIRHRS